MEDFSDRDDSYAYVQLPGGLAVELLDSPTTEKLPVAPMSAGAKPDEGTPST